MSFHPNDVIRRSRAAAIMVSGVLVFLLSGFFRTQILQHRQFATQSEENRLRQIPLPAPRGTIYDRKKQIIAESIVGYSVSFISPSVDSLRATLGRLGSIIPVTSDQIEAAVRRWRQAGSSRPTVIIRDATFDVVSVLEEHKNEFPGLIIQSAPKRYYPDGPAVSAFIGYTAEVNERELNSPQYSSYKMGQQIGKGGLEKQYEDTLRGQEGSRFVEVDARGRIISQPGAAKDLVPVPGRNLETTIDMDLQRYVDSVFADSLIGGAVALDPVTGDVLALYSAPTYDPNRFIGGIPADYWNELRENPRKPLYNKALQGLYPPASTWKLATSAIALEHGLMDIKAKFPIACSGGMQYGSRYFRCWDKKGHGSQDMMGAIRLSCDVYFYQLGLRITLGRFLAGGVKMGFNDKTGIDLPEERKPRWPDAVAYYNRKYGLRGWTNAVTLNLAIGQGENDQTILSMARFYTALATDGSAATPRIAKFQKPRREKLLHLSPAHMDSLRKAMASVVAAGGTAASAALTGGVILAGKTGTAQNSQDPDRDHAWFVGFAPMEAPKIVVAVMIEFGDHGYAAARIASVIIGKYLGVVPRILLQTEG
ncbi:MAG: penicillin-binding protein 2 [Gemmatimonadota bacterium]|nr:penicillin-binding protein 2 [Gemmatimonadota bacterium]